MRIPKGAKPWVACGDRGRYAIDECRLTVIKEDESGILEATDGRVLVALDVELDPGDTSGPIPVSALRAAHATKVSPGRVEANGDIRAWTKGGPITMARYPEDREECDDFPATDDLWPEDRDCTYRVTLSAEKIAAIAASFGAANLEFRFQRFSRRDGNPEIQECRTAITVVPVVGHYHAPAATGRALIMPSA